ncbi:hypothetical protein BFF78_06665 [Streptomyces fodineus]|uniref:Gram-positive cocci surface proteins LPxTG domain-containing protein n=1 Tax=Streptomyces fodineus TaxID=1904616 RepID=A0A1D7Y5A5_9ACTN|nr:hypothetical protein [Streptomyces fodineus]AOR30772.1 hypothetical protein BFF78_06665 [Streptomyces fodineus]
MNFRSWVAAPLAGAAIALVSPSAGLAAQASARNAAGSLWLHEGDGDHGHHNPWRHCHSQRRVVLIDKGLRAILINGRHGPEALVLQGSSSSSSSPAAPWDTFSVSTYLDVTYPTQTSNQYEFAIRDFFKVHPLFEVKAFDRHKRRFPFPAAHCADDEDNGDREDGARPHGGADGSGPSGSPSPQHQNGKGETLAPGGPRDSAAAGWSTDLLSAKTIVIAVGGLLMILGTLAAAWLRRRRSAE